MCAVTCSNYLQKRVRMRAKRDPLLTKPLYTSFSSTNALSTFVVPKYDVEKPIGITLGLYVYERQKFGMNE